MSKAVYSTVIKENILSIKISLFTAVASNKYACNSEGTWGECGKPCVLLLQREFSSRRDLSFR